MTQSLFDMRGRVAVVTGSTKGMGLAMARALGAAGAAVVVSGRSEASSEQAAKALAAEGIDARGIACDIGDPDSVQAFAREALQACGRVDALILNAAASGAVGSILKNTREDFDSVMTGNVLGNMLLINALAPQMIERRDGSITVMSSRAAKRATPMLGLYGMSKAAVDQMVRNLAVDLGPHGINVNTINPGAVRTDFSKDALWGDPQREAALAAQVPMRRIGEADDVAGLAVLLASSAGRFITAQSISVDGGGTA
ncbi:MAG TPA: SDR family oxidoreductase [Burkholderiaceae bacterium]|jgi:NAD(P)-dependent dehydrogenase (short-subunit alcohol dehydrogenase family)|nr:SDR family oxidoreductase [Burkholderiaceae bacterium]